MSNRSNTIQGHINIVCDVIYIMLKILLLYETFFLEMLIFRNEYERVLTLFVHLVHASFVIYLPR